MGHQRRQSLRCRWAVTERGVWSDRIVVVAPLTDDDLGFFQAVEDLTVQQLVTQLAVEAFAVAVLLRTTRFNVERLGAHI